MVSKIAFVAAVVLFVATPLYAQTTGNQQGIGNSVNTFDLGILGVGWTARDIVFVVTPLLNLIGVFLIVYWNRRNVIGEQWLKANEMEIGLLQDKLDRFYGPFMLLSDANHLIAQDLRSRQPDPENHRLLVQLFNPSWRAELPVGDSTLVSQICSNGEKLKILIEENAGRVEPKILPYLSRAMAHFRILWLAHEGKLGTDPDPYKKYVYPRALDPVVREEVKRLERRLKTLRSARSRSHKPIEELDVSSHKMPKWPDPQRPDYDTKTNELIADGSPSGTLAKQ